MNDHEVGAVADAQCEITGDLLFRVSNRKFGGNVDRSLMNVNADGQRAILRIALLARRMRFYTSN